MVTAVSEKKQIAKRVAADILAGCTLLIDSGNTCLEAARVLLQRSDCQIFTNSLPILVEACQYLASVTALGGEVSSVSRALIGSGTLSGLDTLQVDISLIGTRGLHEAEGAFTSESMEANVKTRAIRRAGQAWGGFKWQHAAALRFAEWSDSQRWYIETHTDISFSPEYNFP